MLPVVQIESIFAWKAFKCFVLDNAVSRCVLQDTLGDSTASTINLVHNNSKAIKFSQVLGRQNNTGSSIDNFGLFSWLDKNLIEFTSEKRRESSKFLDTVVGGFVQAAEDVVCWGAPEEVLGGNELGLAWLTQVVAEEVISDCA